MSETPVIPDPAPKPLGCDICRGWDRSGPTAMFFVCRSCAGCRACCRRQAGECGFVAPNRRWRKLLEAHGRRQGKEAAAKQRRDAKAAAQLPPSRR